MEPCRQVKSMNRLRKHPLRQRMPEVWAMIFTLFWSLSGHALDTSLPFIQGKPGIGAKRSGQDVVGAPAARSRTQLLGALPAASAFELDRITTQRREMDSKRVMVGIARPAAFKQMILSADHWTRSADSGWETGFHASSLGAKGLRARLIVSGLNQSLSADFHGRKSAPGQRVTLASEPVGNFTAFWTPFTEGETQYITLRSHADSPPASLAVTMDLISHWPADVKEAVATTGMSATCEEDVACVPNPSAAYLNAIRSTARLSFVENGQSYLCTGTLLSDGDTASEAPYVLTAAHCIDSAATAATLVSFWRFEAPTCGAKNAADYVQVSGGARLLHANSATDVSLLMLNQLAPVGAYFAGWDPNPPSAGESGIALHHPRGDVKKVSVAQLVGATGGSDGAMFTSVAWLAGTTEPGSSGAGLFTLAGSEYRLRGALLGGTASCLTSGQPQNIANRDLFSRLDTDYPRLKSLMLEGPKPLSDYSDVWSAPDETGWILNIRQAADRTCSWFGIPTMRKANRSGMSR